MLGLGETRHLDDDTALHTAARGHCQERFSEWIEIYAGLQRTENWQVQKLFHSGWDYCAEAYRTFPRYRIAKNTQVELERLIPASSANRREMRARIITAAKESHAKLQIQLTNKLAQRALLEDAEDFRAYIETLTPADLKDVEELPYRRVLGEEESKRLWKQVRRNWNIAEGYWFPLKNGPIPPHVLAFHTDYFQNIGGEALLREVLKKRGVSTVFLLHEFGDPEYEIELGVFVPGYRGGGEQYSTSKESDWVVYASHESSITICSVWLTNLFRELCPDWAERTYKGPYSTPDLRGTWETA